MQVHDNLERRPFVIQVTEKQQCKFSHSHIS